jgi:UDP-N-acetylmuramoylalanine--D-glutamate ligase
MATTVQDNYLVVLGSGESGTGAALLAQAKGYRVFVSDQGAIANRYQAVLQQAGIEFESGQHTPAKVLAAQEVVKSPGIPDKAEIVRLVRAQGIPVVSEIEFAARHTRARLVAITGTNGKTTTTLLTYFLLREAGFNVGLAGNVGHSFAEQVVEDKYDWYVLEISSFQLDDAHQFHPQVAVLLNITPDHLDRYDYQMANYVAAKFRLVQQATDGDVLIWYAHDPVLRQEMARRQVGGELLPIEGPAVVGGELVVPWQDRYLTFGQLPLRGEHNLVNMSAAILAALSAGADPEAIRQALPKFVNAPHRLQKVREVNGVTFINDSKATNVDAAYYALGAFDAPLVWIAGGTDKGNDYSRLLELVVRHVKALVCLGKDNSKLLQFFRPLVPKLVDTHSVQEAVQAAYQLAAPGDVVLLSPACASFDLFRNYEDRGRQFAAECEKL